MSKSTPEPTVMGIDDYNYEYVWDHEYCYPNSNVLINKLGITEQENLHIAEREITALEIARAKTVPIKGKFDLNHLCAIHYSIFHRIYIWAGELRHVNIAKGNQFCLWEHLQNYAANIFDALKREEYLIGTRKEDVPIRLAYYLSEINVLHPFREGNGRAQRLFIEYLANIAGYEVDFSEVSGREMIVASAESFVMHYDKMNALFAHITIPISRQVQEDKILLFFDRKSSAYKRFQSY